MFEWLTGLSVDTLYIGYIYIDYGLSIIGLYL